MTALRPTRLFILTHVPHVREARRTLAYAPYAREITEWCKLFDSVSVAAPTQARRDGGDWGAIEATNVELYHVPVPSGGGVWGRARRLACLPFVALKVLAAMQRADVVHVRGPGYLGLVGTMLAPLVAPCRIAKYAGQWGNYPGEPVASRFQRLLLRSRWWGSPVLAYSLGDDEPAHVVPFFSAAISERDLQRADMAMRSRLDRPSRRVLYVGRLTRPKNVHVLLRAVERVRRTGVPLTCTVVGEGSERQSLEELARSLNIREHVRFEGGLPVDEVLTRYEEADLLVLPSETEGWPKVLLEGMAFGLLCVGPNRGIVPHVAAKGAGWVVAPGDVGQLTEVIGECTNLTSEESSRRRSIAHEWGRRFTTDEFSRGLEAVLRRAWEGRFTPARSDATHG